MKAFLVAQRIAGHLVGAPTLPVVMPRYGLAILDVVSDGTIVELVMGLGRPLARIKLEPVAPPGGESKVGTQAVKADVVGIHQDASNHRRELMALARRLQATIKKEQWAAVARLGHELAELTHAGSLGSSHLTVPSGQGKHSAWISALRYGHAGQQREARDAVHQALRDSGESATTLSLAARILCLASAFGEADTLATRAMGTARGSMEREAALHARVYVDGALGAYPEALAAFDELTRGHKAFDAAVEFASRIEAHEEAIRWARLAIKDAHDEVRARLVLAERLCAARRFDEALAVARDAISTNPTTNALLYSARILLRCGGFDEAFEFYSRHLQTHDASPHALIGLATLHLWRGEANQARSVAQDALPGEEDISIRARRIVAASDLLEGLHESALAGLDEVLERDPGDAEARAWRVDALIALGRMEEASAELHLARNASPDGATFYCTVLQFAWLAVFSGGRPVMDGLLRELLATLLSPEDGEMIDDVIRLSDRQSAISEQQRARGMRTLRAALAAMRGNRSPTHPTMFDGEKLIALRPEMPSRTATKEALYSVRRGRENVALRALEERIAKHPRYPHPWYYRAELLMWLGRYEEAQRDLDVARERRFNAPELDRGHWAFVGTAALQVIHGLPLEALATLDDRTRYMNGKPAGPYLAWRAEALRSAGRPAEAREILEQLCVPNPMRVGSWITWALIRHEQGDDAGTRDITRTLMHRAPGLMLETQRALDFPSADVLDMEGRSDGDVVSILKKAQELMKGNRSASCVTFVDIAGRLRIVPPTGVASFVHRDREVAALRVVIASL